MKQIEITPIRRGGAPCDISDFGMEAAQAARAFHRTLPGYAPTPLYSLNALAKAMGVARFWVKDESARFGLNAFKALGGSYAMHALLGNEARTFVTATDGNHGRGVAWAARVLGQRAVVYMPRGSAPERLQNILAQGAEASILDMPYDDAVRYARRQAEAHGWTLLQDTAWAGYTEIPRRIMQGYTTMGLEILEALNTLRPTHVFLQAGVGSMAGAMAAFFANLYGKNRPTVIVVEPFTADCIYRTAQVNDGALHACEGDQMRTIMAGLCCGEPCSIAWEMLRDHADFALRMADEVAATGMRVLGNPLPGDERIISGESGASAAGAAFEIATHPACAQERSRLRLDENSSVLVISTEGDTDRENYRDIVWRGKYPHAL
ncbi:MAG: diaminopropionate ammonia-lyase [Clostridia bacterium]|nr:diaminopropionate ammonia-lyase [Clostridia bacterium]